MKIDKEELFERNLETTLSIAKEFRQKDNFEKCHYLGDLKELALERFRDGCDIGYELEKQMIAFQILNQQGCYSKIQDMKYAALTKYGDVAKCFMKSLQEDLIGRPLTDEEDDIMKIKYNNQQLITENMDNKEIYTKVCEAMLELQKKELSNQYPNYNLDDEEDIANLFEYLYEVCSADLQQYFVNTQRLQMVSQYIDRWNAVNSNDDEKINDIEND